MRYKQIHIEYWTDPDGTDLNSLKEFANEVDRNYYLTINRKRADGYGGGFYDFIVKITEDITLLEMAKSYLEDGIKILIGISIKSTFDLLRRLFANNKKLEPYLDELIIDYRDCKIRIYNIYVGAIEECIDEIMKTLFEFRLDNKKLFKKTKTIHIPIFNEMDCYNLCEYRVLLNVDEPIVSCKRKDYFGYWGISAKKRNLVYNVSNKSIDKKNFYTQKSYDKLFDKAFNEGEI